MPTTAAQVQAAWREVQEETGLSTAHGGVELVRPGLPLVVTDTIKGTQVDIAVHPFLFHQRRACERGEDGTSAACCGAAGAGAGAGTAGPGTDADAYVEPRLCREHTAMEWVEPLEVLHRDWQGLTVPGCALCCPLAPRACQRQLTH